MIIWRLAFSCFLFKHSNLPQYVRCIRNNGAGIGNTVVLCFVYGSFICQES